MHGQEVRGEKPSAYIGSGLLLLSIKKRVLATMKLALDGIRRCEGVQNHLEGVDRRPKMRKNGSYRDLQRRSTVAKVEQQQLLLLSIKQVKTCISPSSCLLLAN